MNTLARHVDRLANAGSFDPSTGEKRYVRVYRQMRSGITGEHDAERPWVAFFWSRGHHELLGRTVTAREGALLTVLARFDYHLRTQASMDQWLAELNEKKAVEWVCRHVDALRSKGVSRRRLARVAWRRVRIHVRRRGILMFWLGCAMRTSCAEGGVGRASDVEAYTAWATEAGSGVPIA